MSRRVGVTFALGDRRYYTAEQAARMQRLDDVVERATRTDEHVWTALVVYMVDPADGPLLLDGENLYEGPLVGCYRCEQPYSDRLARRRCKGDPR